jgi:two-component system response regulator NreC
MKVRVFVADDNEILRSGLRALVNMQPDMEVVGEAANGRDAVTGVQNTESDVVLMDLNMPEGGGLAAVVALKELGSKTRIVVLTAYDDVGYVRAAGRAGAVGYVMKSAVDTELLAAIRAVAQGGTAIDTSLRPVPTEAEGGAGTTLLTGRELDVMRGVAEGFTNGQIADDLRLGLESVEASRSSVMQKLGLASRSALVRFALNCGLFAPNVHAA